MRENGIASDLVDRELNDNDLLQAASYGVDRLSKYQFGEFIRRACRVGTARPHRIHEVIVKLGPTCFITTNYDDLLEQALRTWRPDSYFNTVSNWNLAEAANIVHARATNFVFKPHGDVSTIESIVLTREQYRTLYGDKRYILETLKTLLLSRPILFIGFGLRDLDFLYLKDVLASIYQNTTRDHYALVPTASPAEIDYWRRNYGIHLIGYAEGTPNHDDLLRLLEALRTRPAQLSGQELVPRTAGEQQISIHTRTLALIRYSARISSKYPRSSEILPLRVELGRQGKRPTSRDRASRLHYRSLENALAEKGINFILIGSPGAGKSFGTQQAVTRLAEELSARCIEEDTASDLTVPVYVDLKLFDGDLWGMAQAELPPNLSLQDLLRGSSVRFFIDGVNEVPTEFLDDGRFKTSLDCFLTAVEPSSVVITSRSTDALEHLDWPTLEITEINDSFLEETLSKRGDRLGETHSTEILSILRKPLFFQQYVNGRLDLKLIHHPTDIFGALFERINDQYEADSRRSVDFASLLAPLAYDVIDSGQQTVPLSRLLSQLSRVFGCDAQEAIRISDWLITHGILYPTTQSRLSCVHQSITEYLAATELAKIYQAAPSTLQRCLLRTGWDQTLFLTLVFLPLGSADRFIQEIFEIDLSAALRAVAYLDYDRDRYVSLLLTRVSRQRPADWGETHRIVNALERVPVSSEHVQILREIALSQGDVIGGTAAARLVELTPTISVEELINLLFKRIRDFNFTTNFARALVRVTGIEHLELVTKRLARFKPSSDENRDAGIIAAYEELCRAIDTNTLVSLFPPIKNLRGLQEAALCWALVDRRDRPAIELCAKLIVSGVREAIFALCMQLKYASPEREMVNGILQDLPESSLLNELLAAIYDEAKGRWAGESLIWLSWNFESFASGLKNVAAQASGILRVFILYAIEGPTSAALWEALAGPPKDEPVTPTEANLLMALEELDWEGREDVLVRLLRRKDAALAVALLEPLIDSPSRESQSLALDLGDTAWWLDWMVEEARLPRSSLCYFLGRLLAYYAGQEAARSLIQLFDSGESKYRRVLGAFVLPLVDWLKSDDLSPATLSWLIADLRHGTIGLYGDSLLGGIATERFVEGQLLPLLPESTEPMRSNLVSVLRECGRRHGRRYVTTEGNAI